GTLPLRRPRALRLAPAPLLGGERAVARPRPAGDHAPALRRSALPRLRAVAPPAGALLPVRRVHARALLRRGHHLLPVPGRAALGGLPGRNPRARHEADRRSPRRLRPAGAAPRRLLPRQPRRP